MSETMHNNEPGCHGPSKRASAARRRLHGAAAVLALGAALFPFLAAGASASTPGTSSSVQTLTPAAPGSNPAVQLAATLAQEGDSATQVATALSDTYQVGTGEVTGLLTENGYNGVEIAQALRTVYDARDVDVVFALDSIGYSYGGVALTVSDVYGDSAAQVIDAYGSLGLASGAIASGVSSSLGYQPYTLSTADPFNLFTPLLMGVSGASTSEGASVLQWPANGSLDQDWYVLPSENGYAEIVDRNSGMCMSVAGNSLTPGTQLVQWPCGEANYSQDWFLGSSGTFANWSENNWKVGVHSQLDPFLYAEVEGQSPYAGAPIDQQFWDGGWNQVWTFLQA